MSTSIISRPEVFDHVAETLAKIEKLEPRQYLRLDAADAAYFAPADVWVRPASDFVNPDDVRAAIGTWRSTMSLIDLFSIETGERVGMNELPDGYFREHLEKLPIGQRDTYAIHNAVTKIGEYLCVGRGSWDVVAERVLDGEPAFELISPDEAERRDNAEKAKFMPMAEKHKPSWATKVTVAEVDTFDNLIEVFYESGEFVSADCECKASAVLSQRFAFNMDGQVVDKGRLIPLLDAPEVHLIDDVVTPQDLRHFANGLYRLAVELEDALEEAN